MKQIPEELLDQLLEGYEKPEDLLGREGLLANPQKAVMERALEAELTTHSWFGAAAWKRRWTGSGAAVARRSAFVVQRGRRVTPCRPPARISRASRCRDTCTP